jgi:hypothetical protein
MRFKLTAIGALALIPSLALAQQTTSDTTQRDTTYTTSEGVLVEPSANFGLTTDQVKQLQKAINDNGCNAGDVTGTVDDATREGIQCIREARGIEGTDINEVLKALGLPFTAGTTSEQNAISDSMANDTTDSTMRSDTTFQTDSGVLQRDTTTLPDTSAIPRDTTMFPRDTSAMTRDSMPSMPMNPPTTTTLPDTSRTPFQH